MQIAIERKGENKISLFRGDAHRLFNRFRKSKESLKKDPYIQEAADIYHYYAAIDSRTLQLIRYRMIKEKNGAGMIPLLVAAVPWLLFLFSEQLQDFLFKEGSLLWLIFCTFYMILLVGGVLLHFREKAWAAFHIEMIQDILDERKDS